MGAEKIFFEEVVLERGREMTRSCIDRAVTGNISHIWNVLHGGGWGEDLGFIGQPAKSAERWEYSVRKGPAGML